jgi:hypothetical protein
LSTALAAARLHFLEMFAPLYDVESWRTSFLEGELAASRFFNKEVQPLVDAKRGGDRFALARVGDRRIDVAVERRRGPILGSGFAFGGEDRAAVHPRNPGAARAGR